MPAFTLTLPSLSPTMNSGTLAEWKVAEGDFIESGQVIAAIGTDKSTVDYESLDEGYLKKILLPAGGETEVGQIIAILTEEEGEEWETFMQESLDAQAAAAAPVVEETEDSTEDDTPVATKAAPAAAGPALAAYIPTVDVPKEVAGPIGAIDNSKKVKASGKARKIASQRDINLAAVEPKTTGSRIVAEDLANLPDGYGKTYADRSTGLVGYVNRSSDSHQDIPLSQMRKAITDRMIQACTGVPAFQLSVNVEMDKLQDVRAQLNSMEGTRVSVNDFIVKAVALALRVHPEVNAAYQGDYIRQFNDVDISVAVAIPDGLITPIVRSADTKGLTAIGKDVKQLVGKARTNTLSPDEYQGGSFTISNLGMFGAVDSFSAILNPPQAAILAVAGTRKELKLVAGAVTEVSLCKLNITADHRVIDGALAAQFMNTLKQLIEAPAQLLL